MNDYDDLDKRSDLGFRTGVIVFFIVWIALAILNGGWGVLLGWIAALLVAAPTTYAIYRFEPVARFFGLLGEIIGAIMTIPNIPRF